MVIAFIGGHLDSADPQLEAGRLVLLATLAAGSRLRFDRLLALCQHGNLKQMWISMKDCYLDLKLLKDNFINLNGKFKFMKPF